MRLRAGKGEICAKVTTIFQTFLTT